MMMSLTRIVAVTLIPIDVLKLNLYVVSFSMTLRHFLIDYSIYDVII